MTKWVFQRRMITGHHVRWPCTSETSQRTAYSNATGWEPVISRSSGSSPFAGPSKGPDPWNVIARTCTCSTGSTRVQVSTRPAGSSQPFL